MKTLRDYEDELTEEYKDWVVQGRLTRVNITTLAEAAMLRDHAEAIEKLEKRVEALEERARPGAHTGPEIIHLLPINGIDAADLRKRNIGGEGTVWYEDNRGAKEAEDFIKDVMERNGNTHF